METIKLELKEGEILTEDTFFSMYDRGEIAGPYTAVNGDGEDMVITVSKDLVEVRTYQKNGWIRINGYDRDGYRTESYAK